MASDYSFPDNFVPSSTPSTGKEVAKDLLPLIRVYKDGSVERLLGSPFVPPSSPDPKTGVSSKDISISTNPNISARIYLPNLDQNHDHNDRKLPILVYFHGGGFCIESAFSFIDHRYLNHLVSESRALAISVEYRLAPESPLPAAYVDCWAALQWVASHSSTLEPVIVQEPWLISHGDFGRLYIGGDSAGANIVHNVALRAGTESLPACAKLHGAFLTHPYFWGSKPIGSEPKEGFENAIERLVWEFAYPSATGGIDDPMIDPVSGGGAPSLAGLGCSRMLVCVAGKDRLRERGVWYYEAVKGSGWEGEVKLFEVNEEDHAFHIYYIDSPNGNAMIKRLASFLV